MDEVDAKTVPVLDGKTKRVISSVDPGWNASLSGQQEPRDVRLVETGHD